MDTEKSEEPEGWTDTEYKTFRVGESDSDSDSESESESEEPKTKGYQAKKYKKILVVEELVPE
jgi:hypothetical protein|tara:strand:- start:7309 stop:7497 length:189 start_codon:yes stop_codon:yes gene_type:complete